MTMNDYAFMEMAKIFATYSTCSRLRVGAVLVRERRIFSTGYNGAPSGLAHCYHAEGDDRPCEKAVHAEANVIAFAAKHGVSTEGSTLYTTHAPCINCAKLIINAGIAKVIYGETYRETAGESILGQAGIPVTHLK